MQINVANSVVPVYPSGAGAALTLFNNGPGIVFLGADTSLAVNNGFPLTAGSAIVWDEGQPLYLISDTSAVLYLIENSGPSALGQLSLAPGATIGLAPGSSVGLASGSQVGLASGSSVAVSSLPPDTSKYWPCVAGENYAPTFSGGMAYSTLAGNPCVRRGTSGTSNANSATWNALSRYGPDGNTKNTVITGLMCIINPTGTATQDNFLSWLASGSTNSIASIVMRYTSVASVPHASVGLNGTFLDTTDYLGAWMYFEWVFNSSMTRLTLAHDVTRRITTPPMPDSMITAAFNLFTPQANGPYDGISNLFVTYTDTVSP